MSNTQSAKTCVQTMPVPSNKLQIINIKTFLRINKRNVSYKKYKTSYFEAATKVRGSEIL